MTTPYICASCRTHLIRRSAQLKSQWQSRATFISMKEPHPAELSDIPSIQRDGGKKFKPASRNGQLRVPYKAGHDSRTDSRDDILEKLFALSAEVHRPSHRTSPLDVTDKDRGETLPSLQNGQNSWLQNLEHTIADPQTQLSVSWQLFRQHYGRRNSPGYTNPLAQDRVKLSRGTVFQALLKATVKVWSQLDLPAGVPSPIEAIELFTNLGIMRDHFWAETIWSMLASIINQEEDIHSHSEPGDRRLALSQYDQIGGLAGILEVWKSFFATFVPKAETSNQQNQKPCDWSFLPDTKALRSVRSGFARDLHLRFLHVLPGIPNSSTSRSLTLAMVSTFSVLYPYLQREEACKASTSDALHFAHFVAHLLPYAELGLPKAKSHLMSLELFRPHTINNLTSQWEHITEQAMAVLTIAREKALPQGESNTELTDGGFHLDSSMETLFLKRLSRTVERMDLYRAEQLWLEVQEWYKQKPFSPSLDGLANSENTRSHPNGSSSGVPMAEIPARLYHRFLMVFMALRRPQRAIDVWNSMISAGQQPTAASWCAMLDGCGTARDAKALEDVWQKMCVSGVKPNVGCWTSRIHGLISGGWWEKGVLALEEMGNKWKDAVRRSQKYKIAGDLLNYSITGDVDGIVKPNTVTVNAAVSALLRQRKQDATRKVLRWATSFQIKFDIYTFNTLLRTALREGRTDEAQELTRRMEVAAIKPDVVTFTMILDGIFRNADPSISTLSATDQQTTVKNILDEMEASGIAPNVYTYGTIIDGLLKQDLNLPAARAIFDHMAARNIKSSPHINTMLLTHHFAQLPPDLTEIEGLWNRIRLEGGFVDSIFYDRMIEGYASLGETEKMMKFLLRMSHEGMAPGWEALCSVIQALRESDDWERLNGIITDARGQRGLFKDGIRGTKGEENFWRLVGECELKRSAAPE
ncbi:MAG: hypothetical protein M1835_001511 [Candelina submexicana]|nr:MAG: hypothetical protein M1835_001511 [Candelina submexicana]